MGLWWHGQIAEPGTARRDLKLRPAERIQTLLAEPGDEHTKYHGISRQNSLCISGVFGCGVIERLKNVLALFKCYYGSKRVFPLFIIPVSLAVTFSPWVLVCAFFRRLKFRLNNCQFPDLFVFPEFEYWNIYTYISSVTFVFYTLGRVCWVRTWRRERRDVTGPLQRAISSPAEMERTPLGRKWAGSKLGRRGEAEADPR